MQIVPKVLIDASVVEIEPNEITHAMTNVFSNMQNLQ